MNFKRWWKLQWSNGYIFIFLVALIALIIEIIKWEDLSENIFIYVLALTIPIAVMFFTVWLGFIKYWKEEKNDPDLKA